MTNDRHLSVRLPLVMPLLVLLGGCGKGALKPSGPSGANATVNQNAGQTVLTSPESRGFGAHKLALVPMSGLGTALVSATIAQKLNGASYALFAADGTTWIVDETTGGVKINPPPFPAPAATSVFALPTGEVWLLDASSIARSAGPVNSDGSDLTGGKIAIPAQGGAGQSGPVYHLLALDQTRALLYGGDAKVLLAVFANGSLQLQTIDLPTNLFDSKSNPPLAAGYGSDGQSIWFMTKAGVRLMRQGAGANADGFVWVEEPLSLDTAGDNPVAAAMYLTISGANQARIDGSIVAVSSKAIYSTEPTAKALINHSTQPLTWTLDVRGIFEQRCSVCHTLQNDLTQEATWHQDKAVIISRLTVPAPAGMNPMPPPDTPQANTMTQAERDTVIKWLNQN